MIIHAKRIYKKIGKSIFLHSIRKFPERRFLWDCNARATIIAKNRLEKMSFEEINLLPVDYSDTVEWIEEVKGIKVSLEVNILERNPEYIQVQVSTDSIPISVFCCTTIAIDVVVYKVP